MSLLGVACCVPVLHVCAQVYVPLGGTLPKRILLLALDAPCAVIVHQGTSCTHRLTM